MKTNHYKSKNRREFIKDCLRIGIGGGLIITGAILGLRKNTRGESDSFCQLSVPCKGCSKYTGCSLPRAQNAKKSATKEGSNRGGK
jgi:hypothetical protein